MARKNVFVVGADPFNMAKLRSIGYADEVVFHELLTFDEVKGKGDYPFEQCLDQATDRLERLGCHIDAIVGYWDFPVTSMVAILCHRFGCMGPSLEGVLRCEHKYWSRMEQKRVAPDITPDFCVVNPFDNEAFDKIRLKTPFWVKPIKSTSSVLAFRIRDRDDFEQAMAGTRRNIGRIGRPFNQVLSHAELPPAVAAVDGHCCIAEESAYGEQCTAEGYVHHGEVHVHGIVDSINYPETSSFFRYEYPSRLDERVKARIRDASARLIEAIAYDDGCFNIEYFYDAPSDRLAVLEINPRISQSHSDIFEKVDGVANHKIMVELALGAAPRFPCGEGAFKVAAKFHMRVFKDGVVRHRPDANEIDGVKARFPGTEVEVMVDEGQRLSDMLEQDAYSFDVAHLHMGADDERQLLDRYRRAVKDLHFQIG